METPNNNPTAKKPLIVFPTVTIPQGNGSFLVQPGKPEIIRDEIPTAKFAKETGMSQRNAARLCDEGLVKCRRLSPKGKSKYMIEIGEVARFHAQGIETLPINLQPKPAQTKNAPLSIGREIPGERRSRAVRTPKIAPSPSRSAAVRGKKNNRT